MNINTFLENIKLDYNSPVILTYLIISLIAGILNTITRGKTNKVFTHCIGHQDYNHFMHNFLFILLIGPMIEEKYGSYLLIIMFLITSLFISLFNIIFNNYRITGASGNVYMLIVLSSFSNITEGKIPVTLILILIFYILSEVKNSITEGNKTIYHDGHLIGAFCGILFGFILLYYPGIVNILIK